MPPVIRVYDVAGDGLAGRDFAQDRHAAAGNRSRNRQRMANRSPSAGSPGLASPAAARRRLAAMLWLERGRGGDSARV
ncbi:hypothetical protein [Paracoccus mutanolyticus]|uniref:hypothetical protein n=1 Tax=Paracoccus mutanolyticus TaxID=1499308 RepID=UPI00167926FD|nr:hypothetical protein [Paracoccus mutanolyticus]